VSNLRKVSAISAPLNFTAAIGQFLRLLNLPNLLLFSLIVSLLHLKNDCVVKLLLPGDVAAVISTA
jgi:hypothetical protein